MGHWSLYMSVTCWLDSPSLLPHPVVIKFTSSKIGHGLNMPLLNSCYVCFRALGQASVVLERLRGLPSLIPFKYNCSPSPYHLKAVNLAQDPTWLLHRKLLAISCGQIIWSVLNIVLGTGDSKQRHSRFRRQTGTTPCQGTLCVKIAVRVMCTGYNESFLWDRREL